MMGPKKYEKPVRIHPTGSHDPDPAADQQSSHVFEAGLGGAMGAVAVGGVGAAAAGPVGAAVGVAVGALAGVYVGRGVGEMVGPTAEEEWLRDTFPTRPHAEGSTYEDYEPAYDFARAAEPIYRDRPFHEIENELRAGWDRTEHAASLPWEDAREAVRAVFEYRAARRHVGATDTVASPAPAASAAAEDVETFRRHPDAF